MNGPKMNGPKMTGGPNGLFPLISDLLRQTFARPRDAARRVIAMGEAVETRTLWLVLLLVVILTTIISHMASVIFLGAEVSADLGAPVISALGTYAIEAFTACAVVYVGRRFGGHGGWRGALAVTIWLEIVILALLFVQLVVYAVLPIWGDTSLLIIQAVLSFALLSIFVAELHGFRSAIKVFLGICGTIFAFSLALGSVVALLGISISGI